MAAKNELPTFIDNEVIKKVNDWMKRSLTTHTDDGTIDFKTMIHNAEFNIGDVQADASGLVMQEEAKLADMESAYDEARAEHLNTLMTTATPFEKTPERVNTLLDGKTDSNPKKDLVKLKNTIKKQKAYVAHLKRYCEQLKFYTNGVKTILDTYDRARDAGKI